MDHDGFAWFWLIFLLIPLMRIIPRVMKRIRKKEGTTETFQSSQFEQSSNDVIQEVPEKNSKLQTKDMLVLGELNRGTKSFENMRKNTGMEENELNSILEDLEKRGLMRVEKKGGVLGVKIELYPTDKGFKEYYS